MAHPARRFLAARRCQAVQKIHVDRLLLTRAAGVAIDKVLSLLGIRTIERM